MAKDSYPKPRPAPTRYLQLYPDPENFVLEDAIARPNFMLDQISRIIWDFAQEEGLIDYA